MTIWERFVDAVNHKDIQPVPVVMWDNAVPITRLMDIKAEEYYRNPEKTYTTQKRILDEFPQIRWVPGFHADFGVVIEPSAFGCPIQWFEDDSPHAHPAIDDFSQVNSLRIPDPYTDGLMPEALAMYRYFWDHIEPNYIDEYGYLAGFGLTLGPLETAASLRGFSNILMDIYDHPTQLHQMLEIVTDGLLRWLKAQEMVNGKLRLLVMIDHVPGNISLEHAQEFAFPYFKHIFDQYPNAIRLYHNEGKSDHYVTEIPKFGGQIFHCGKVDLARAKELVGDQVCFMGNLDANTILLNGNTKEVKIASLEKLRIAAPGGGYLLCTGGAMSPGTPKENLFAMVEATRVYALEQNETINPIQE